MEYTTTSRRRRRRRLTPILLLTAAGIVLIALLAAVVLSLRSHSAEPEPEPDPHEGQVYINDGANMVWLTPHEGVTPAGLLAEDFRRDENDDGTPGQRVRYLGTEYATRWGVDVSNHQGAIDWSTLKKQGVDFAYLRIGLRGYGDEGTLYPDRSFESYYAGARAAGVDVGVYMFSQATTLREAADEALYVLRLLNGRALQLPVYFDWEPVSAEDSRTNGYDYANLTDSAEAFCQTIQAAGYQAGVYINRQQGYYHYDLSRLADYSLWVADYNSYPDFYYRFDMWQYTASGQVEGFDIQVDENLLFVPKN